MIQQAHKGSKQSLVPQSITAEGMPDRKGTKATGGKPAFGLAERTSVVNSMHFAEDP